jgi:hypothetical protein
VFPAWTDFLSGRFDAASYRRRIAVLRKLMLSGYLAERDATVRYDNFVERIVSAARIGEMSGGEPRTVVAEMYRRFSSPGPLTSISTNAMRRNADLAGSVDPVELRGKIGPLLTGLIGLLPRTPAAFKRKLEIALLRRSSLVDEGYYLNRYPDVAASGVDAVVHYVLSGAAEGRDPNRWFETVSYASGVPPEWRRVNPLIHLIALAMKKIELPYRPSMT